MKKLLTLALMLVTLAVANAATPDNQGYYTYNVKYVNSDGSSSTGGTQKVKILNNGMAYNIFCYGIEPAQYKYDHSSNGNDVYYRLVYNVGGFGTSSGYQKDENQRMIVGPGMRKINVTSSYGNQTTVLTLVDNNDIDNLIE